MPSMTSAPDETFLFHQNCLSCLFCVYDDKQRNRLGEGGDALIFGLRVGHSLRGWRNPPPAPAVRPSALQPGLFLYQPKCPRIKAPTFQHSAVETGLVPVNLAKLWWHNDSSGSGARWFC